MDLRSGYSFWPIKNGLMEVYPPLDQDQRAEVAIIGGGITGALLAYHFIEAGIEAVVVDKRDVGKGSTSASTALLQYEIDTHLTDLIKMVGKEHAERAYQLCWNSIDQLEAIAQKIGGEVGFQRKTSLYYASTQRDVRALKQEYDARRGMGLTLEYWDQGTLKEHYGFNRPAALYSPQAAEVDPYRMAQKLLEYCVQKGLRVYDRTTVKGWKQREDWWHLETDRGHTIAAKRLVFATGYEAEQYLKQRMAVLRNSYALVSEPLKPGEGWHQNSLVWESARPYIYVRTTSDNRVVMGGEDESYRTLPLREKRIPGKQQRLEKKFKELFPHIELETAFAWAGTFGETKDGLAYIGESPELPGALWALGYGGNGITYSLVAAEILRDMHLGKDNPDRHIFRFDR